MKNQWLAINQLDRQLKEWQAVHNKYGKPRAGWIKTLRTALNMSAEQLANRLGLTRGRINQLENAEVHNAVTLRALNEAANALGCELIYAIVPKNNSTLENIIKVQANQIAKEQVARVAHSMSLEAQSIDAAMLKNQKDELANSLMEHLNKKFWATPDKFSILAEKIYAMMEKNNEKILTEKNIYNSTIFFKKLEEYLVQIQPNSADDLKNPEFLNALKNALIRYQKNSKKQNKQTDSLQKLIEILQKKK